MLRNENDEAMIITHNRHLLRSVLDIDQSGGSSAQSRNTPDKGVMNKAQKNT